MRDEKILIVENESIIARDLELSLKRLGWEICGIGYTGQEAIEKSKQLKPDLILMDIKLGKGIDGIDAALKIASFADIPIIYLTAYADEETLERAKITNPSGYIIKPFDERSLHVTIEMGLHNYWMEKQLKEKDKWLELIIENLNEGLIVTDRNAKIQLINPAAEFYTGWKKEAAIGLHYLEVLNAVNIYTGAKVDIPFYQAMEKVMEVELDAEIQLKGLNNREFTIDGKCVPVVDDSGAISGAIMVFYDITHRKRLECQLRHAKKMEAIGTFAGGIAHDFNNILSAIMGNTELSIKKMPPHSFNQKHLDNVLTATKRAKELVNQILNFSDQSKERKKPVQLSLIVKEVLQLISSSLPKNIRIDLKLKSPDGMLLADPIQIHQVIMNLFTNAIQAMRESGGTLSITLEETDNSLLLYVSDTGHGMDNQTMARIFEPYFTTKEQHEGTGMGLAVVHSIIKKNLGNINVHSTLGKGTTFQITLPKIKDLPKEQQILREYYTKGNEQILYVDDEQPLLDIGKELLGQYGYFVEGRTNAAKALEDFRCDPYQYDLIILDYIMPHMTGIQLAHELLKVRPDMPIILCSGFSDENAIKQAQEVGVIEVIMKPIISEQLAILIRKILDKKRTTKSDNSSEIYNTQSQKDKGYRGKPIVFL